MAKEIDVRLADPTVIDSWMELAEKVRDIFPGFETKRQMDDYRRSVERGIANRNGICAMDGGRVAGFILFSTELNMLCHMAVDPDYRRMGIASRMLTLMIAELDRGRDISVITFREGDPKADAPRAVYRSFGFEEDALCYKFGYPEQRLVLCANRNSGSCVVS